MAVHEAGHALAAYLLPGADPQNRITIIPRGRSLGMTEQMPKEERHNYTQDYLENRIVILLGGRAAEKIRLMISVLGPPTISNRLLFWPDK